MESDQRSPAGTEAEACASDAPAPGRSGDSMGDDTRKTGHILIVDDDDDLRTRMERMVCSTAAFGANQNIDTVPTSRYVFRTPFDTNRPRGKANR